MYRWSELLKKLESNELSKDIIYLVSFPMHDLHMLFELSSKLMDYRAIFECTDNYNEVVVTEVYE